MGSLADKIRNRIDSDNAVRLLEKYYGGHYSGSRFDTNAELVSPSPNRFDVHDIAAVATLSVPLAGWAVVELLERGDELEELLVALGDDRDLVDVADEDLDAL